MYHYNRGGARLGIFAYRLQALVPSVGYVIQTVRYSAEEMCSMKPISEEYP